MLKLKDFKVGQVIEYRSFNKPCRATIKKIVPTDQRELKINPEYLKSSGNLVSIKFTNVIKIIK